MNIKELKEEWNRCNRRLHAFDEVFCKDSHYPRGKIKNFLTKVNYLKNCCSICGISDWMDKPIILQLDHIDGDRNNNTIDNFRLICPNCHSQTETFSRRKSETKIPTPKSDSEFIEVISTSENARQALIKLGLQAFGGNYDRIRKIKKEFNVEFKSRESKIPPMQELLEKITNHPIIDVGKFYGVSDNAVRKWLVKYGIPKTRNELKQFLMDNDINYAVKWRVHEHYAKGEDIINSKLNENLVKEIRKLSQNGWSQRSIANLMGVSRGSIRGVLDGSTWKHVK